jgi:aerobic-type carbon monoxide dehydrogenase small subunit (CoxS/CutS family)
MIEFTLNGAVTRASEQHPHLLAALREELGITSPKDGCAPSGQCGCCTVLVDGKATISCQMAMSKVAGKTVLTLEGFEPTERDRLARAFAATGALQCGFCTPGIVVAATDLFERSPSPTPVEIREALAGNICRCTGYGAILRALEGLAAR